MYVYSKSLPNDSKSNNQNIDLLASIEEIDYFKFFNNVLPPNEVLPNSVFVFDDVACDKQHAIRENFAMGRHADVDCFYLRQIYARSKIAKHVICHIANLLILFKQDDTNLKHVYNHVNTDLTRISVNCC